MVLSLLSDSDVRFTRPILSVLVRERIKRDIFSLNRCQTDIFSERSMNLKSAVSIM